MEAAACLMAGACRYLQGQLKLKLLHVYEIHLCVALVSQLKNI